MYRELIDHLTFVYSFIAKGRGKMERGAMEKIGSGAHTMVENAPEVLGGEVQTQQDGQDIGECQLMLGHIDEMILYLNNTEII